MNAIIYFYLLIVIGHAAQPIFTKHLL